jgi:hypothetical protein
MRDGATVNLYMNKVSERYGHTRVRWQSGLVRVQTEGGVKLKRYTSTDGRESVETLRKWMNTYKDKLREENAAYIEGLLNNATSKQGEDPQQGGDPQHQRDTQMTQEIEHEKEEVINAGTGTEDTLKARVPSWVYNECKKIGATKNEGKEETRKTIFIPHEERAAQQRDQEVQEEVMGTPP